MAYPSQLPEGGGRPSKYEVAVNPGQVYWLEDRRTFCPPQNVWSIVIAVTMPSSSAAASLRLRCKHP